MLHSSDHYMRDLKYSTWKIILIEGEIGNLNTLNLGPRLEDISKDTALSLSKKYLLVHLSIFFRYLNPLQYGS